MDPLIKSQPKRLFLRFFAESCQPLIIKIPLMLLHVIGIFERLTELRVTCVIIAFCYPGVTPEKKSVTKALSVKFVENAKPGTSRKEIPDGDFPGFYLTRSSCS